MIWGEDQIMGDLGSRVAMESQEIQRTLERLAGEIYEEAVDAEKLVLVGIHTGGVYLARRLRDLIGGRFQLKVPVGSLDITLYRDDWTRLHTQPVVKATELPFPIDDREVVLVDDVLYTGRTIRAALDALVDYGRPKRVQVAVLVDRGHRELPICSQFVGIELRTREDEMVNVLLKEKDMSDQVVIEKKLKT
jgi:pyrimidine operon attenuation protein/uracil phosphoribosyltransferase